MEKSKNEYLEEFIEKFLIPKIGSKPFTNLKDIRNRKKIFNTINEIFEEKLEIQLTEVEKNELKNSLLEKYKNERENEND